MYKHVITALYALQLGAAAVVAAGFTYQALHCLLAWRPVLALLMGAMALVAWGWMFAPARRSWREFRQQR